jgi:RNase P subunit RPR2
MICPNCRKPLIWREDLNEFQEEIEVILLNYSCYDCSIDVIKRIPVEGESS